MKGIFHKYLDINLSTQRISELDIPEKWYEKHLGGRGIAARIYIKEMGKIRDSFGEDNILIFATGPFQGTMIPGAGRHGVFSKSPKTNTFNESYAGGFFNHELGTSGYDGVVIRGKSENPVYIIILKGKVNILDASEIWGKTTDQTTEWIKSKHGKKVRVSCIGPAGEKLIPFSCIINDFNRAAGRPGFGAVMGSKNLKALAIKGSKEKVFADEDKLKELRSQFARELLNDPTMGDFGELGTTGGVLGLNELGILPTRNFKDGYFKFAEEISGQKMAETILTGRATCTGCPVRCKRVVKTEFMGEEVKEKFDGPEYETIGAFGSVCLNNNLDSIALANQKCNQYGLDTISTGNLISFTMEATEKGLIENGIQWGDAEAIITAIDKIISKKGLGELLSKGLAEVAREIGGEEFAVHVKGQEVPLHEPRGKKGLGISYATSPRGATHLEAMHDTMIEHDNALPELSITEGVNRLSWKRKAEFCKKFEDLYSFCNSLIICGFNSWDRVTGEYNPLSMILEMLSAVTGLELDTGQLMEIGERNYVIRKVITANDGYTSDDDSLPKRLMEPLQSGVCEGESIPDGKLKSVLKHYYELREFDKYGPTDSKLRNLGLDDLVKKMKRNS